MNLKELLKFEPKKLLIYLFVFALLIIVGFFPNIGFLLLFTFPAGSAFILAGNLLSINTGFLLVLLFSIIWSYLISSVFFGLLDKKLRFDALKLAGIMFVIVIIFVVISLPPPPPNRF